MRLSSSSAAVEAFLDPHDPRERWVGGRVVNERPYPAFKESRLFGDDP